MCAPHLEDLFEVVIEDGLTEETARPLFRELVLALAHLHDKNVIHCDVKPENAFVTGRPGEPDRGGARRDTFEPSSIPVGLISSRVMCRFCLT